MEIELKNNNIICNQVEDVAIEIDLDTKSIKGIEKFFKMIIIEKEINFPSETVTISNACKDYLKDCVSSDILELFEELCVKINEKHA